MRVLVVVVMVIGHGSGGGGGVYVYVSVVCWPLCTSVSGGQRTTSGDVPQELQYFD